jgi:hypothetical protein
MNAAYFNAGTAIGLSIAAGNAFTTTEIGDEGERLARYKFTCTVCLYKICCQLMTEYARIIEIGLSTLESMQVSAANTDTPDL